MHFSTDKQTLDDLNIFGKRGGDSIFAIYNHTHTDGGARILEELFNYPLADDKKINERSAIIKSFAASDISFPFENELFRSAEQYLADHDERTLLSPQVDDLRKKLTYLIASDPAFKVIYKGVTALVSILQTARQFIQTASTESMVAYNATSKLLKELLYDTAFEGLIGEKLSGKIVYGKVAEYDKLLRFRHRNKVLEILRHLYRLDVFLTIASVAIERKFVFPVALPKVANALLLEGVYHPQVKNAIGNTIDMSSGSSVIFLTGANMAGKSTFMKSFGTAMYLAHMGFPVAAAKMEFSVRDGIYTTINLPDDLSVGASHFYAEVLRIKKIAREINTKKYLFIIFDELFRGTNVKDAYEATIAITSAFAQTRRALFVISTHIVEAGPVLRQRHLNIRFKFLPTRMNGTRPVYPYKLEHGITDDRHGMVIINNEGIIEMLKQHSPKNLPA
jgi:DNA mismatch repair protein MutS